MKLVLNNVGIIKDSEINLNGLTIITGENNSGKTTIGKTMFSIVAAVENIEEMALQDKCVYSIAAMKKAVESMDLSRVYRQYTDTLDEEIQCDNNIECIIWNKNLKFSNLQELIRFIQTLMQDIKLLTKDELLGKFKVNFDKEIISRRFDERWNNIVENKKTAVIMLSQLIETIQADQQLIDYANIKIMKYLNGEFFNQIFPVKKLEQEATSIILKKDSIKYYDISIKNKELKDDGECYFISAFNKCWFIDDVDVIDEMNSFYLWQKNAERRRIPYRDIQEVGYNDFKKQIIRNTHRGYLLEGLTKDINEYEQSVHERNNKNIFDLINNEFSENIKFFESKFICEGDKLDVRNLASGSKLFAIIKLLLQKGLVDGKSLIVIDEPENHLHPRWQNNLAEILVLLVKNIEVKIVVTTHSPNFLLALDTMSKKHKLDKKFSLYAAERSNDNYMVELKNITDTIEYAFSSLAKPYLEMDELRYQFEEDKE